MKIKFKKNQIIIAGPTAVGKTSVSIELAKKLRGEIVSADSMQIYKEMDIGTAKISKKEMENIPHHLIDVVSPMEEFTVSDYSEMAKKIISEIKSRERYPIVVGGTGLYINALLYDMDFNEAEPNRKFREAMEILRQEKGNNHLYDLLLEKNPKIASSLHPNNYKRVIRALEILESNEDFTQFSSLDRSDHRPQYNIYILFLEREILYNRINERVDQMIKDGLIEEVQQLINRGCNKNLSSMKGIGYRQIIDYFDGEISLDSAVELIKRDSRRYAKRQFTWFRRYKEARWINVQNKSSEDVVQEILWDMNK